MSSPAPRPKPKSNLWRTVKAVAWSFVGLRSRSSFEEDIKQVGVLHIIAVGLVGIVVFVAALALLVNWVVAR